jgi:hypothetical protein
MAPTQIFRINKTSPIEDQYLFTNGLGPLTSYMAREGITDIGEGLGEFLHAAEEFHRLRNDSLESYSERKARDKGRKNSTINNIKNSPLIEHLMRHRLKPIAAQRIRPKRERQFTSRLIRLRWQ